MRMHNLRYIFLLMSFLASCTDNSQEPSMPSYADYTQVDFEPSWSRDGTKIVYAHSNVDHQRSGIYMINSNGTGNSQLIEEFARSPHWMTDNNNILYSQNGSINKLNIPADSIISLTGMNNCLYAKLNGNGTLITFSADNGSGRSVYLMNTDGSNVRLIDNDSDYPSWSASTDIILYFKRSNDNTGNRNGDTLKDYSVAADTSNTLAIFASTEHYINSYPLDAVDGIVFCSMDTAGYNYIYFRRFNGDISKLTISQGYSPDYSLIRQKIIYTNRDPGNGRLWMMNKDGTGKEQITN